MFDVKSRFAMLEAVGLEIFWTWETLYLGRHGLFYNIAYGLWQEVQDCLLGLHNRFADKIKQCFRHSWVLKALDYGFQELYVLECQDNWGKDFIDVFFISIKGTTSV